MPLMDCYLTQIDKGARRQHQQAVPTRISARPGRRPSCSRCGRTRLHTRTAKEGHDAWETHDVFSLPHGNWITHKADETDAVPGHRPRRATSTRSPQGAIRERILSTAHPYEQCAITSRRR